MDAGVSNAGAVAGIALHVPGDRVVVRFGLTVLREPTLQMTGASETQMERAIVEALVQAEKRLQLVAQDLVEHFENRVAAMSGKAMVVCMSRRICMALYDEVVKLGPDWHNNDDDKGLVKVVMTGSATDPQGWQKRLEGKARPPRQTSFFDIVPGTSASGCRSCSAA